MSIRFLLKIILFFSCIYGLNITINAQTIKRANSPYSYFGIGDLEPTTFGMSRAFGGLSIGLRTATNTMVDNPASLSAIKRTTFETGFDFNSIRLNNGTETQSMSDMGISYLALTVPVTKYWGSSLGFLPFSSVYYDIEEEIVNDLEGVGTQLFTSEGQGSLYQFYWGNGFNYKTFSAGFQLAYVFGSLERTTLSTYPDVSEILPYLLDENEQIGGFIWKSGLQFHPKISDRIRLTVGANWSASTNLNVKNESSLGRSSTVIDGQLVGDTVAIIQSSEEYKIKLPSQFGFGATVNRGSEWMAGFDIELANWGSTNLSDVNADYRNTIKVKVGAGFMPYREGIRKFFNQTQYRFGAYFNNNYFDARAVATESFEAINQYGFTFGAGFPLSKKRSSRLNIAFDVGQRGTTSNSLVRETFFKAHIGLTLNDIWFIKPKYD